MWRFASVSSWFFSMVQLSWFDFFLNQFTKPLGPSLGVNWMWTKMNDNALKSECVGFFFNISKNASFESLTIILSSLVFTSLHFSYPHVFVCIHLKFQQTLLQWRRGLILLLNLYMLWTSKIWILQGEWEEFAILSLFYASIGALRDEHMESRTNIQFIDHLVLGSWTMKKFRNQLEWNILYLNVCVRGSFGRKKMISILR